MFNMTIRLFLYIFGNILINHLIIFNRFLDSTFVIAFWFTILSNRFLYRFRIVLDFKYTRSFLDFRFLWGFFWWWYLRFWFFFNFLWLFCKFHLFFHVLFSSLHYFYPFAVHFLFFFQLIFNFFFFVILFSLIEFSITKAMIRMTIIISKRLR